MKYLKSTLISGALFITLIMPPLKTLSSTPIELEEAFSKSKYYEGIGDYKNSVNVLSQVESSNPNSFMLQVRQGYLWAVLGAQANAEFHYKSAIKMIPNAIPPALGLMRIYNQQLRFERTEELAYRVLKTDPYNYYTNTYLSYALRQQKKNALALQVNQRMLALYPNDVIFLSELALLKYSDKEFDETKRIVHSLFIIDPENPVAKDLHYLLLRNATELAGKK